MKHLPKSTLTEITELYKQPFHKKKIYQYQQKKSIKVAILKSMFMN